MEEKIKQKEKNYETVKRNNLMKDKNEEEQKRDESDKVKDKTKEKGTVR